VEVAELQAAFTHEELLLRHVLGLGDDVVVNASGGALRENPIMATGLCRIGHAADHVSRGGDRALAHATSGPCLQQNLVCILEGSSR
jgi:acetyl-CoA acetyltransferase